MIYSEMVNLLYDTLCTLKTNHPNLDIYYENDAERQQFVVHVKIDIDYIYAYILTYEQVETIGDDLYDYCITMHNEYVRKNKNEI